VKTPEEFFDSKPKDVIEQTAMFNGFMGGREQLCPNGYIGHVCMDGICTVCGDFAITEQEFRSQFA
jgi:hypothetical protein